LTLLHVSIRCVLLHILTFMTVDRSYLASERGRFRLAAAVCATVKCEPPNSTRIVRNICELTSVIHWLNWVFLAAAKCLKNDEHLTELSVLSVLSSVCYSDVTWRRGFDYFCVLHMFWLLFSDLRMRFIALFICFPLGLCACIAVNCDVWQSQIVEQVGRVGQQYTVILLKRCICSPVAEYCDEHVCLCVHNHVFGTTCPVSTSFCRACYLWPWFDSPLVVLHCRI